MTLEMTLGLIAICTVIALVSLLILDIKLSNKVSERNLKEYREHMAKLDEVLEEKAKREGGRRSVDWNEYRYLSDLWED